MYTRRSSVHNLGKQDIREIPFDKLFLACVGEATDAVEKAEEKLKASVAVSSEKYIAMLTSKMAKTLEGMEGVEEAIREAKENFAPITALSQDEIKELKRQAFVKVCDAFCTEYSLKARAEWLPAALVNLVGTWTPKKSTKVSTVEGGTAKDAVNAKLYPIFDCKSTLDAVLGSGDSWVRGVYYFMMYAKRGSFLETQYKEPASHYCSLVPLILSGFKKFQNIQYSQWDPETLHWMLEPALYEAVTCEVPDGLTSQELLGIREAGMLIRTGAKAGTARNPLTTYKLWGINDCLIGGLPWLAQVMLTQIWCAHPSARNKYMILDPKNLDNMPAPLINVDIMKEQVNSDVPPKKARPYGVKSEFSWEL